MNKLQEILQQLNPEQRRAAEFRDGVAMVIAGPGTGKTQVVAARVANLIMSDPAVDPNNILLITFTEAGVKAMRERIVTMIGSNGYYVNIYTFHSLANEIIQKNSHKFKVFSRSPQQLDDLTQIKVIRQIIDNSLHKEEKQLISLSDPYSNVREIISRIKDFKKETVSPETAITRSKEHLKFLNENPIHTRTGSFNSDYLAELKRTGKSLEVSEIYKQYQQVLSTENYYDYEDMIMEVISQLEIDEELLGELREQYQYILVDEYQDTNPAQNKLVELIATHPLGDEPNLFIVGDDDQSVYSFQGANISNILDFRDNYSNVETILITKNYRSSQPVLNFAQASIKNNLDRLENVIPEIQKKLTAEKENSTQLPVVSIFNSPDEEISFVVNKIKHLKSLGVNFSDIAIIYRNHVDAEDFIDALLKNSIPINLTAGGNVLAERSAIEIITLLKAINSDPVYASETSLWNILNFDFFEFDMLDLYKIAINNSKINAYKQPDQIKLLYQIISSPKELERIGVNDIEGLVQFSTKLVDWYTYSRSYSLIETFSKVLEESGMINNLFSDKYTLEEVNAVNSLFEYIKQQNRVNTQMKLADFISDLALLEEQGLIIKETAVRSDSDSVNLMTAHGSKGLEFEHVFIIKCNERKWGKKKNSNKINIPEVIFGIEPIDKKEKSKAQEADERRLFFVACTRAKKGLNITNSNIYFTDKSYSESSLSQFVSEVPVNLYELIEESINEQDTLEAIKSKISPLILPDYTKVEKDYLKSLVANFKLSASALNEYLEDPIMFKENRLLRIPSLPMPHVALGNAVHYAFEQWGRRIISNEVVSLVDLNSWFKNSLDIQLVFGKDYQHLQAEGLKLVSEYYDEYKNNFGDVAAVEYNFGQHNVMLELSNQNPIQLTGKIDKIVWLDKKENLVRLVDYKTSSPKTDGEIRGNTKSSEGNILNQLVFYVLMANLDEKFKHNSKMSKYNIQDTLVDFIKQDSKGKYIQRQVEISKQDISDLKEKITEVMTKIRNLEF